MRNKMLQRISQDAVKIRSNKGALKVLKKKKCPMKLIASRK